MSVIEVTQDNFAAEVLGSDKPVIADFNAEWCGPCKMMKPILDQIAAERDDIKIVSINIDDEDELTEEYEVSSIPCLVVFKGGKEVNRNIGLVQKEAVLALLGGN